MNSIHPSDIDLLAVAFPKRGRKVDESVVMHVLCCPHCMENVMNMREMDAIMSESNSADSEFVHEEINKTTPYHPVYNNDVVASHMPVAAAAESSEQSSFIQTYLDSDENGASYSESEEDDADFLPDLDDSFISD